MLMTNLNHIDAHIKSKFNRLCDISTLISTTILKINASQNSPISVKQNFNSLPYGNRFTIDFNGSHLTEIINTLLITRNNRIMAIKTIITSILIKFTLEALSYTQEF